MNFTGGSVYWTSTQKTVAIFTVEAGYLSMSKAYVVILLFRTMLESVYRK